MNFKPFYIKTRDLTKEQVVEVIDKSVEAGAELFEGVIGFHQVEDDQYPNDWEYVGVDRYNRTIFWDVSADYHEEDEVATEITFEQLDEHLGLEVDVPTPVTRDEAWALSVKEFLDEIKPDSEIVYGQIPRSHFYHFYHQANRLLEPLLPKEREIVTLPNGDKYYADELQEALCKINKIVD